MGTGFTGHCSAHFSAHRKCFSSKCSSHSTECFVAIQSFLLTKHTHYLCYSAFVKENEYLQFASFLYWQNQNFGAAHSLTIPKTQGSNFCRVLKTYLQKSEFHKVRGLQPETCNCSNNKYFHRYFSRILLNLIRQLLKKYFSNDCF